MKQASSDQFDAWLADDGPVAIVVREYLVPVDGEGGVVFPPTFAASEKQPKGGYNIDDVGSPQAPRHVALMDSVGSQANRMEPLFKRPDLRELVPQVVIKAGDREVNLLDAGHRAADAIARSTELAPELKEAFTSWQRDGQATKLASIAPTSLLFGAWDSRDTQAKLPRLIASTIRAFGVKTLTRSAQYVPAVDYVGEGLVDGAEKKDLDALSELGFRHAPAAGTHGGVLVEGDIRRDVVLSLVGLRALGGTDAAATRKLQRYILGLGLVALATPRTHDLRQGCLLVSDPERPAQVEVVSRDGKRSPAALDDESARAFAMLAAREFGVGASRTVSFDKKRASDAVKQARDAKKKGAGD